MADPTVPSSTGSNSGADLKPSNKRRTTTRTRNGCLVCRSRRVKCDLEKPECRRCVNYGAECVYPQKKWFDPQAIEDRLRKRHVHSNPPPPAHQHSQTISGEGSSKGSSTEPIVSTFPAHLSPAPPSPRHGEAPTSYASGICSPSLRSLGRTPLTQVKRMDPMELLMALCRDTRMGQFFLGPVDPPEFLRDTFPDEDELRCFHHCFTYTLSTMVVNEDVNPWVDLIIPLFLCPTSEAPLSVAALRLGTLATGAVHLASLEEKGGAPNTNGHTRNLGFKYREEGVKYLRAARDIEEEVKSDVFLAACMMMSNADLLGANQFWREVLRLARASIHLRGGCERALFGNPKEGIYIRPTALRVCLVEHLVLLEVMSCMTTGQPCVVLDEGSGWWEKLERKDPVLPDTIESYAGIHRSVMPLMVRVNNLLWEHLQYFKYISPTLDTQSAWVADVNQRTASTCKDLDVWYEQVVPVIRHKRTQDGSVALWHGLQILVKKELLGKARGDAEVQKHAMDTLAICEQVGPKVEGMSWPLLIASSVLVEPFHRQRAREIIRSFTCQTAYETAVVEEVIEECWRRIDDGMDDEGCSWREILVEMGCAVMLG
ncbi:hypothetical protein C366_04350 [Cryptococcus neoformans Tu401-1]|nr:hypothetical protein C365_06091 [Cryptococcus neoformans var. grubii Bt85]OXG15217.1 hypothetical protein C366_04350 [Cryptococcus neoformans var. grubii Tu401-1]